MSARNPPARLPPPSGRGTRCPGGPRLGPRPDPGSPGSPPGPRPRRRGGPFPGAHWQGAEWETQARKLGPRERGRGGGQRRTPGRSGRRSVRRPRAAGTERNLRHGGREGTRDAGGPQPGYSGKLGPPASIRSVSYLVPSLPGMTREGEEKPGKAPGTSEGRPPPRRARPSYLVQNRSLRPWGCASYGPQGEAAAQRPAVARDAPRCWRP